MIHVISPSLHEMKQEFLTEIRGNPEENQEFPAVAIGNVLTPFCAILV